MLCKCWGLGPYLCIWNHLHGRVPSSSLCFGNFYNLMISLMVQGHSWLRERKRRARGKWMNNEQPWSYAICQPCVWLTLKGHVLYLQVGQKHLFWRLFHSTFSWPHVLPTSDKSHSCCRHWCRYRCLCIPASVERIWSVSIVSSHCQCRSPQCWHFVFLVRLTVHGCGLVTKTS